MPNQYHSHPPVPPATAANIPRNHLNPSPLRQKPLSVTGRIGFSLSPHRPQGRLDIERHNDEMALHSGSMLFSLETKDILGPAVSIFAACVSGWLWFENFKMNRKMADRSIYVDGQKFLIEICNHLISDPLLWFIYNDCPLEKEKFPEVTSPLFEPKLRAFAHLHLNMFEIVLNEAPAPGIRKKKNASNVWFNYFRDTLNRSDIIRAILEEPESRKIWSPVLFREYGNWKRKHDHANGAKS